MGEAIVAERLKKSQWLTVLKNEMIFSRKTSGN
jgi:hypothetical protein